MNDTPRLYLAATGHIYNGMCPDDEQPHARDKECPACRLLIEVERGGWKLVPVEPTPGMEMAARNHHSLTTHYEDHRISIWRAMLDAAPTPLAQAGGQDDEMVSLGGTAPPVPRWLLDAVQHIEQYMGAHSPGDWAIGGIQKRQASEQDAEIEALRAEVERLREQLRLATVDQAIAEAEANDAHAENKRLQEALATQQQGGRTDD